MQRRAFLATATVGVASGCLGERPTRSQLAWIWLQNDRDERHEVDVIVEDDGEVVFADEFALPTRSSETTDVRESSPVDGPGQYVVRATLDGEWREVDTTEYVDGDEDCIGVRFSLLNDGSATTWTKSMQEC